MEPNLYSHYYTVKSGYKLRSTYFLVTTFTLLHREAIPTGMHSSCEQTTSANYPQPYASTSHISTPVQKWSILTLTSTCIYVTKIVPSLHVYWEELCVHSSSFHCALVCSDYITASLVIVIVTDGKPAGLKKQIERKLTPSESTGFRDITRSKEGNVQWMVRTTIYCLDREVKLIDFPMFSAE
jgi:hypothetical protein